MKPTSPLSLLLFLHLTTGTSAAPIALNRDCQHYASCDPTLREVLSEIASHHKPPVSAPIAGSAPGSSSPHFPSHQVENLLPQPAHPTSPFAEEPFSNKPVRPAGSVSPNAALSAQVPLESSYLLSLTAQPASYAQRPLTDASNPTPSTHGLPAKPTSALPALRKEDERRYWESVAQGERVKQEAALANAPVNGKQDYRDAMKASIAKCTQYLEREKYDEMRGWSGNKAREYSDMLVVGIVVLFLCSVIVVEAIEKLSELYQSRYGSSAERRIRLRDDEEICIVHAPFHLQPAPRTRKSRSWSPVSLVQEKLSPVPEIENEFSSFSDAETEYDLNADEKA
ncbi:hypothetical protein BP5796_11456 [Coleophoma crateriformis]|uniref:Uncharacterized protein n=1 Tax=Coleophoma crateriformis TaxID=565419 RepID=A0A3D8QJF3_9HELO|nr:hypothetical protein BP5796_11456 [Coleophoma crateriformis]